MHHNNRMQENLQDYGALVFLQQDLQDDVMVRLFLLQQDLVQMDT